MVGAAVVVTQVGHHPEHFVEKLHLKSLQRLLWLEIVPLLVDGLLSGVLKEVFRQVIQH